MLQRLLVAALLIPTLAAAQGLSVAQYNGLSHYISFVDDCVEDVNPFSSQLKYLYETWRKETKYAREFPMRFECHFEWNEQDEKNYQDAITDKSLGAYSAGLASKAALLKESCMKLDKTCKDMEIYFRLGDYKKDQFKKLFEFFKASEELLALHRTNEQSLVRNLNEAFAKLQPYNAANGYAKSDQKLRAPIVQLKSLLGKWAINRTSEVPTEWPREAVAQLIIANRKQVAELKSLPPLGQEPAYYFKLVIESIEQLESTLQGAVDGYTFEAQKSDDYSNEVYYRIHNENHNLVSLYNMFLGRALNAGYRGLPLEENLIIIESRTSKKEISLQVTPFADKEPVTLKPTPVVTPVPAAARKSLMNYVDLINDATRQVNNSMPSMHNLNTSAAYNVKKLKEGKKVSLQFYDKDFELPLTQYQKALDESANVPAAYRKELNAQSEVLYAILKEMYQWNAVLLTDDETKQLTKDSIRHVYAILERYKALVEAYDTKKEVLYENIRAIFNAYKPVNAKSSWHVTGTALEAANRTTIAEIKKSKPHFVDGGPIGSDAGIVEGQGRELIKNEFINLQGIKKIEGSGLDPYWRYTNIAQATLTLSEKIRAFQKDKPYSVWNHPYNDAIHLYNQAINDYNEFVGLAQVPLLRSIEQVKWFTVLPPDEPIEAAKMTQPVAETISQREDEPATKGVSNKDEKKTTVGTTVVTPTPVVAATQQRMQNQNQVTTEGRVIHDTVRITDIIRIETRRQDTVYIEKTDTVYIGMPGDNTLSMAGYAVNNMVLLLDVSGSMNSPDKLPLLKKSVLTILKIMRAEDEISIITYSGKATVVLPPTSCKEEKKIASIIEKLSSKGDTDGNAGIEKAYSVADKNYIRGGNNRLILATDGEFPISAESFDLVKKYAGEDIFISVFNFGKSTVSAKNLQQLATLGKGHYEYINRTNADLKLISEAKAKKIK